MAAKAPTRKPVRKPQPALRLDPDDAMRFIEGYQRVLLEIHRQTSRRKPGRDVIKTLATAREQLKETPEWLERATSALAAAGTPVEPDLLHALRSMQIDRWIHLRSTTRHAIFIDSAAENAYAVLGLTESIDDLLGGAAVAFETAIVPFAGSYLCDGIVQGPILLGPSYRRDFNAALARIRKAGRFHNAPASGDA